jgi:hypothetical protein
VRGEVHTRFRWRILRERDRLEDPGVGEENIKMYLQEVVWRRSMDWIDLAQNRERWKSRWNALMNLGFHKVQGFS